MSKKQLNDIGAAIEDTLERHRLQRLGILTVERAQTLIRSGERPLVVADTADPSALALLRAEGIPYHVDQTGETYLPPQAERTTPRRRSRTGVFSPRASRIARWLLLHPNEQFTVSTLAEAADVNISVASRAVATLSQEGFVRVERDPHDWRAYAIQLLAPRPLLAAWAADARRSRPASLRVDIGTRTVKDTLRVLADARSAVDAPSMLSGLAGAARLIRAVEPADVLLLTSSDGAAKWQRSLLADPDPQRGSLQIGVIDDPFLFRLADESNGKLAVADPVQLWLDATLSGERGNVAAENIAEYMGW